MKSIYVVAGEASGDVHGSHLIEALKKMQPDIEVAGAGGEHMRPLCTKEFIETAHLNATGLTEILKYLPQYWRLFRQILLSLNEVKPDVVVLIDNPGFNLRLAKRIQELGIPIVYYICPQIWAWNPGRIHLMKRCLKKALVVFDFEQKIYKDHGVPVTWVGHPLTDQINTQTKRSSASAQPRVLLMPGSRAHEVRNLLPLMLIACKELRREFSQISFSLLKATTLEDDFYAEYLEKAQIPVHLIRDNKYQAMREADLGLICSGTATLECALMNLPIIVLYRASFLTFLAAKLLTQTRFLAIPNLLARRQIVPELLQYDATVANLHSQALRLLKDKTAANQMKENLQNATAGLSQSNASDNAAREILNIV